jgi:hypothetical protein
MSVDTSSTESMKEAMKKALKRSHQAPPSTISRLIKLLGEVQEALREDGYPETVLELRQGLQTDYGLRYTAYLRDASSRFENPMFAVFVADDQCAFQAEGQIQNGMNVESVIARAREYLLQAHVVEFMTGLLGQFGRNVSRDVDTTSSGH